jgi:hypothetical protein
MVVLFFLMISPSSLVLAHNNAVNTSRLIAVQNKQIENTNHTDDDQEYPDQKTRSKNGASTNENQVRRSKERNNWDYYLCSFISGMTCLGVALLIWLSYSKQHSKGLEEQRNALHLIVVALIVEAVLIAGILGVDIAQFDTIYAAIVGYVLGSIGGRQYIETGGKGRGGSGATERIL